MIVDGLLIIVAAVSFGYLAYMIVRKFPQIVSINVHAVPQHKQILIKRQLLEEKLKRDIGERWRAFKDLFLGAQKERIRNFFSGIYARLKELEHEYKIARKRDLSSHLSKSQSLGEMINEARKQLAGEEFHRAEQLLLDCLKLDEHNVTVYMLLAEVYRERGEYDHATETLEFVVQLTDAQDPEVYERMASIALERGDFSVAQQDYLKSISLAPENHKYHLELAEVFAMMGVNDKAREAAQKAQVLAPNNPKILDFLIENSIILQDANRAHEYLAKLMDVNPQNGKIPSFKTRIEKIRH